MKKKILQIISPALCTLLFLAACGKTASQDMETEISPTDSPEIPIVEPQAESQMPGIDNTAWQYRADSDVYWQVGIAYCDSPADKSYETLGVFVPGAYMDAADNGDGTFTCQIAPAGKVGDFTADNAPFVIPVNTPGYSAMAALTDYSGDVEEYTGAGFIYVHAGCRGRDAGAPAGVTDLKAAIRFIRHSADNLPGDTDRFFSFGMSGGGAQSALLGATGDSSLYNPYLEAIGAVMSESDAVMGSMCWCPITNLDMADEAYEWNMGVTRSGLDSEMKTLSDAMAEAYAFYINRLGLKDSSGTVLLLSESENGIYQSGSYYDYLKTVIETSLEHFLSDTDFPYDASSSGMGQDMMGGIGGRDGMGGFDQGGLPDGNPRDIGNGELPDGNPRGIGNREDGTRFNRNGNQVGGQTGGFIDENGDFQSDGIDRGGAGASGGGLSLSGTYETPQDYVNALNENGQWVSYDASTGKVEITGIADFVSRMKTASKSVGAFDDLENSQGENTLFGYGDGRGAHFDAVMAEILADIGSGYAAAYASDLTRTDSLGSSVATRVDMYNPLYYLCDYYDGMGTSSVAEYWRIRTGIEQGDTALNTEVNLALALGNAGKTVDFETVWGQGHTMAERTGSSTENFIAWVMDCLK